MTWWPGWDSIESVGFWSHFWFWFGIVSFLALGGSQVVSHIYSLRKDELIAAAARTEAKRLREQLGDANKRLSQIQPSRRMTTQQKQKIIEALKPYSGQPVSVVTMIGSDDGADFAADFMEVFRGANWNIAQGSPSQVASNPPTVGLAMAVNPEGIPAGSMPVQLQGLGKALLDNGVDISREIFRNPQLPVGAIEMRIGVRPGPR